MKTFILIIIVAFVSFFGGNYLVTKTSDDKFCVSCHEWMDPMTNAYHNSNHGGNSSLGVKAKCAECHLPHDDSKIAYMFKKAANGISEVTYMLFHDAKSMDWEKNRQRRDEYVFDSGCLNCHTNIGKEPSKSQNVKQMHAKWLEFKDSKGSEKLSCVSCHKNVGHEGLGKILYERKNPPVGVWSESDKKYD